MRGMRWTNFLLAVGQRGKILADHQWKGHTFCTFPETIFFFSEKCHDFYQGNLIGHLATQQMAGGRHRTNYLKGFVHFVDIVERMGAKPVFVRGGYEGMNENPRQQGSGSDSQRHAQLVSRLLQSALHSQKKSDIYNYLKQSVLFTPEDINVGRRLVRWLGFPTLLAPQRKETTLLVQTAQSIKNASVFSNSVYTYARGAPQISFFFHSLKNPQITTLLAEDLRDCNLSAEQVLEIAALVIKLERDEVSGFKLSDLISLVEENRKGKIDFLSALKHKVPSQVIRDIESQKREVLSPGQTDSELLSAQPLDSPDELRRQLITWVPGINEGNLDCLDVITTVYTRILQRRESVKQSNWQQRGPTESTSSQTPTPQSHKARGYEGDFGAENNRGSPKGGSGTDSFEPKFQKATKAVQTPVSAGKTDSLPPTDPSRGSVLKDTKAESSVTEADAPSSVLPLAVGELPKKKRGRPAKIPNPDDPQPKQKKIKKLKEI